MSRVLQPFSFKYTRSNAGLSLSEPLQVLPKQVIWLTGNSGSGKSTFLHLLKGFYPEFLNGTLTGASPDIFKSAAYMAQNPLSQIVHERVGEEFFFSMENAAYSFERMHAARSWLNHFGLAQQEFAPTSLLSHGLSQRLLLACMFAFESDWVVFDEPSAFLNPAMREDFYARLEQIKGQVGMLLIDHHPHAAQLADVCWHVDGNGQISAMSVPEWLDTQARQLEQETQHPVALAHIAPLSQTLTLSAHDLCIGHKKQALFTANFTLRSGDCVVLVGENGAGKSTLFNTLAGIHKAISGSFKLEIQQKPLKASSQMAYVYQHPDSHFFCDTIAQELQQLGVQNLETTLSSIGLQERAHSSAHQLSEGQKRRLTLLYPCLQERPLVLLDEPTFGQDAVNTQRIVALINQLKQAGYALIVICHDEQLQNAIATQVWHVKEQQFFVSKVSQ